MAYENSPYHETCKKNYSIDCFNKDVGCNWQDYCRAEYYKKQLDVALKIMAECGSCVLKMSES